MLHPCGSCTCQLAREPQLCSSFQLSSDLLELSLTDSNPDNSETLAWNTTITYGRKSHPETLCARRPITRHLKPTGTRQVILPVSAQRKLTTHAAQRSRNVITSLVVSDRRRCYFFFSLFPSAGLSDRSICIEPAFALARKAAIRAGID